ncbi:MAG: S8 family serine peptidase [Dehalococcoidia bacterium]|nr:S8 family serine peptidase [Dehalococcoidia bacterium]
MESPRRHPWLALAWCVLAVTAGVLWAWSPDATSGASGASGGFAHVFAHVEDGGGALVAADEGFLLLDDEFLGEQWGLFNWGQSLGEAVTGTVDADIRAPEAWAISRGSHEVVVAVIDTGVDYAHPDLAANMWLNPGEMGEGRESNGVDDDGNGYVDDWRGWDFLDQDNDPRDELSSVGPGAAVGHGTAVASVLGAVGDNGIGISGVAPAVSIMALRVAGAGTVSDLGTAEAIDYAAANGARIVNISIVSAVPDWSNLPVDEAIARHPDVLFVVSAGNQGNSVDLLNLEPCSQGHENIICVGASDGDHAIARWLGGAGGSNWGSTTVDLLAPGVAVAVAAPSLETVFEDTFEGPLDASRWASTGEWGTRDGRLHDSPDGPHSRDHDTWVQMALPVDLHGRAGCWLAISGIEADTAGATMVLTEVSRDGSRWQPRMGRNVMASAALSAPGQPLPSIYLPLDREQDGPFYLRFRLRPSMTAEMQPGDGVSIDAVRVECLATPEAASTSRGAYGFAQGTSFSAPHVSGAAALILAAYPDLSTLEVKRALMDGARPDANLLGRVVSGGHLDAAGALDAAGRIAGVPPAEAAALPGPPDVPRPVAEVELGPAGGLLELPWGQAGDPPASRGAGGIDGGRAPARETGAIPIR